MWDYLAAIKPTYIMVLSLISWPDNLISYALVLFREDGPMYWYKVEVLEGYFGKAFTDNIKAFRSLLVNLQFYKV